MFTFPSPTNRSRRYAGALLTLLLLTAACGTATTTNLPPSVTPVVVPSATPLAPAVLISRLTAPPLPATNTPPPASATAPPPSSTPAPPTATLAAATPTGAPPAATATAPPGTPGAVPAVPVLAYHHFGVPDAGDYDCPLDKFEAQLQWLNKNGYESILPQQLVDAIHGRASLPRHPVVITFDDDLSEQYTDAAPLLERYGYHGAFFIDTVTIGKRYFMSEAQLKDLVRRGHILGSHTWDHRNIAILTLPELRKQLDFSESALSDIMDHKPEFISYPFGAYNEDSVAELKARGYKGGFRLHDRAPVQVDPEFMIVRQIVPGVWSINDFADNIHWMEP